MSGGRRPRGGARRRRGLRFRCRRRSRASSTPRDWRYRTSLKRSVEVKGSRFERQSHQDPPTPSSPGTLPGRFTPPVRPAASRHAGEWVRSRPLLTAFPLGLAPIEWSPLVVSRSRRVLGEQSPLSRREGACRHTPHTRDLEQGRCQVSPTGEVGLTHHDPGARGPISRLAPGLRAPRMGHHLLTDTGRPCQSARVMSAEPAARLAAARLAP